MKHGVMLWGMCTAIGCGETRPVADVLRAEVIDASDERPSIDVPTLPPIRLRARCETSFCATELPSTGSVVALGDADNDGRIDVLLGQVGPLMEHAGPLVLLRNAGEGVFEDITVRAGLAGWSAWSAIFGDLDNDGDQDLVLGGRSPAEGPGGHGVEHVLWNHRGHFAERTLLRRATVLHGVPITLDLIDLDLDGRLDLLSGAAGTRREGDYRTRALIQQSDGRFEAMAPLPDDEGFAWVAYASDINYDGRTDFFMAHDGFALNELTPQGADASCEPNISFVVRSGWINAAYTITGVPGAPTLQREPVAREYTSTTLTPMGIAAIDHDRDGRLGWFMTNSINDVLIVPDGNGGYVDVAARVGATLGAQGERALPSSWSALARDLDRDGWPDLLVTRGVLIDSKSAGHNVIFMNQQGRFVQRARGSGFDPEGPWSALAAADLDGDLDDDLVLGAQTLYLRRCDVFQRPALLLRNDLPRGDHHVLRVRLVGTVSNREGLGAHVEAMVGDARIVREVSRGGGTMSTSDPTVDLGLGSVERVSRLRVTWPSGYVQDLADVRADQHLVIEEPRWLDASSREVARGAVVTVRVTGLEGATGLRWHLTGRNARWVEAPTMGVGRVTGMGDVVVGVTAERPRLHGGVRVRFGP